VLSARYGSTHLPSDVDTERDLRQIDVGIVEHAQCGIALRSQKPSIESRPHVARDPNHDTTRCRHTEQRGVVVERRKAILRAEVNSCNADGRSRRQAADIPCPWPNPSAAVSSSGLPVIKMTGNARTATTMADNIDLDVSGVMTNAEPLAVAADRVFAEILAVCSGSTTAAERLGHREFAIHRRNPTI